MSDPQQPTFLVSAYTDPVLVRISGKANYLNCSDFRTFTEKMVALGKHDIVLDFEDCLGMDSTFLGILAGAALGLRKQTPPGMLRLCKLSKRNHELICNLGLQNLLTIQEDLPEALNEADSEFRGLKNAKVDTTQHILNAHQNLVKADRQNAAKFQDVIAFLKNQAEADSGK